jgi:hypothetical protein
MTICGDWAKILKQYNGDAFSKTAPFVPRCAYIDGMPLLMISQRTVEWSQLIRFHYAAPIKRLFSLGARVVILAFDVYDFVPAAKQITQHNRVKTKVKVDFNDYQQLPAKIPDNYSDCICNRTFKKKVISMVVEHIIDYLVSDMGDGQKLIIDYTQCPIEMCVDAATKEVTHNFMHDVPVMGECDVKFTRWIQRYGSCVLHSVDGDFIPIALLEYERQLRDADTSKSENRSTKLGPANVANINQNSANVANISQNSANVANIAIYRMECNISGQKRGAGSTARPMEYVNIKPLYETITQCLKKCHMGQALPPNLSLHQVDLWAYLVGLTGTDFSRSIPNIGTNSVWAFMSKRGIFRDLVSAYDPTTGQMDVNIICDKVISKLYVEKYTQHAYGRDLSAVLQSLRNAPKLAASVKSRSVFVTFLSL